MLKASIYAISTLLVAGVAHLGALSEGAGLTMYNWHEECQVEGCDQEELQELYNTYSEECLNEACDTGEVRRDAGGDQYIDPMLANFLAAGWVVNSQNFQSAMGPPAGALWWYTGCENTGLVTQQGGSATSLPNGFNDRNQALQLGSGVQRVRVWTDPNYTGNHLDLFTAVLCFASTYQQFANNVGSAQVNF